MQESAILLAIGILASSCSAGTGDVPEKSKASRSEVSNPVPKARRSSSPEEGGPDRTRWLLAEGERYLSDASFRRRALEDSLTEPGNVYSRSRLTAYGLGDRGWDMLPEWNPLVRPIDSELAAELARGGRLQRAGVEPIWDGKRPTSMDEWVALGRKVFYEYPLRSEVFAEHALRSASIAKRVGLGPDETGKWAGLVAFATLDGNVEVGITCALCHVDLEGGRKVEGRARRNFDYGEMRLSYYRDTGAFLSEDIRRRMETWGPGRADITQDETEDPVAIVDLWGVADHSYLTQSGTLTHAHPAALAIRQETQILHANHERARPPRELAWALAMFVYSLEPPSLEASTTKGSLENADLVAAGKNTFEKLCAHCHSDRSYAGGLWLAEKIGTDQRLAQGKARGTGRYRPSPLIRVAEAAPYFHDGSVPTLESVLDPRRKEPGHRYGVDLSAEEKQGLLAFMRSL